MTVTDLDTPPSAANRQFLRLATVGSVDDGKSTLIGRLRHDAQALVEDQLDTRASPKRTHRANMASSTASRTDRANPQGS